ncbi:MAG: hypothetical protein IKE63_00960 [Bacilli bacterium]|nr:hypothetical protein [Bacilli bacterium]
MDSENNKKKSIIKIVTIIILIISFFNVIYIMHYEITIVAGRSAGCCEMADDTEKEKYDKKIAYEEGQKRAAFAEAKLEETKPICSKIGIMCLIGLIVTFIASFVKKEIKNTKVLIGISIALNIFFILLEL